MSNLIDHAKRELDIVGAYDDEYSAMVADAVIELLEVFSNQEHSGFSASLTIDAFEKLASFKNLSPLTDDPEDWVEVGYDVWQCRRSSDCFSEDAGKTYYSVNDPERIKHNSVSYEEKK